MAAIIKNETQTGLSHLCDKSHWGTVPHTSYDHRRTVGRLPLNTRLMYFDLLKLDVSEEQI